MFIVALVVLAAALVALYNRAGKPAAWLFAVAALLTFLSSFEIVETRNVGIVTAFNKPTGRETGAGWQWILPWQNIDDWDARRQTFDHMSEATDLTVRIAGQREAYVEVQIEWVSRKASASENWALYGKTAENQERFDAFTDRRVDKQLTSAVNDVFGDFDPLATVDRGTGREVAPNLNTLYRQPTINRINALIGNDIEVASLAYGIIRYDKPTSDAIAALGSKVLEARTLAVEEKNAATRKRITNENNAKVDPVARCLEISDAKGKEPGLCVAGNVALTRAVP